MKFSLFKIVELFSIFKVEYVVVILLNIEALTSISGSSVKLVKYKVCSYLVHTFLYFN